MSAAEGSVVHAYGLVADAPSLSLPEGVDGAPVTLMRLGEVSVLVSELSAKDYGPEVWRAHAEDPKWLEHVARQHHAVLQAMVEQTVVSGGRRVCFFEGPDGVQLEFIEMKK